jgi:hypothetical protein
MEKKAKTAPAFKLPDRLVSSVDLMRTLRELKGLDDWLNQAAIRSGGEKVNPPKTSATLDEVSSKNGVSLLDNAQRQQLITILESFAVKAPKIHIAFAVEPSANFLIQLVNWLRANIHPMILLDVGLQPALAAGCSVRTTNKLFDMSLRNRFVDSRHFLAEAIDAIEDKISPVVVASQNVETPQAVPKPQATESATPPQPTEQPQTTEVQKP